MLNYMFQTITISVRLYQILSKLLYIFDLNNSYYAHKVLSSVDDKFMDKL